MRNVVAPIVIATAVLVACMGEDPSLSTAGSSGVTPDAGPDPFDGLDAGSLPCDAQEVVPDDAVHVSSDASDGGDGTSLAPFKSLADALAKVTGPKLFVLAE